MPEQKPEGGMSRKPRTPRQPRAPRQPRTPRTGASWAAEYHAALAADRQTMTLDEAKKHVRTLAFTHMKRHRAGIKETRYQIRIWCRGLPSGVKGKAIAYADQHLAELVKLDEQLKAPASHGLIIARSQRTNDELLDYRRRIGWVPPPRDAA